MTKFFTAAALILAVSAGSIVTTTSAEAGPKHSFSIKGQGQGNPFGAINGR